MTLADIEQTLPNGLHDAELVRLEVDYSLGQASLCLNIDMSNASERSPKNDEYQLSRLTFKDLQFVVIDPPNVDSDYPGISLVSAGMGQPRTSPQDLPAIRADCFLCWFFISRSNSFIRLAARDTSLEWINPPSPRAS
jgi:hypothetical protein